MRTYQGEPAMKLESCAREGEDVLNLEPEFSGQVLKTSQLAETIFENRTVYPVSDLAYSTQLYLAEGLAELALSVAYNEDVQAIGFSGGVGYNEHITNTLKKKIEGEGFGFYVHTRLPAGDGGISFGQAFKVVLDSDH